VDQPLGADSGSAMSPTAQDPPNRRPVRLTVADDLERSRGTVFFRALFALPFMIWLPVWAVGAFLVALVNWAATLVTGKSPEPLHGFLSRFVRCATQVYAYLNLAAEPLPGFDGKPGYPVDVEIDPPRRQSRWSVAFRIALAIPALLPLIALTGYGSNVYNVFQQNTGAAAFTVLSLTAFLGWLYAVARGRMARGLRDLAAYSLSYGAQFWAYLLLLTDRYPSADPLSAISPLPTRSDPVRMEVRDGLRRSRLTTFFRLPLAFPHLAWLSLWAVLALAAAVVNWVAVLAAGSSPRWLHRFLSAYLRYQLQVSAFLYLVGNPFPGFVGAEGRYPIELRIDGPTAQNRWTVLFRAVLALPALLLAAAFGWLLLIAAALGWFTALFTGRMPLGLRNAGALALRYAAQTHAYVFLLSGAYPYSGPCRERAPARPAPPAPAMPAPQAA
jgi:hypothetical protein